jgi:hypothetical protein
MILPSFGMRGFPGQIGLALAGLRSRGLQIGKSGFAGFQAEPALDAARSVLLPSPPAAAITQPVRREGSDA